MGSSRCPPCCRRSRLARPITFFPRLSAVRSKGASCPSIGRLIPEPVLRTLRLNRALGLLIRRDRRQQGGPSRYSANPKLARTVRCREIVAPGCGLAAAAARPPRETLRQGGIAPRPRERRASASEAGRRARGSGQDSPESAKAARRSREAGTERRRPTAPHPAAPPPPPRTAAAPRRGCRCRPCPAGSCWRTARTRGCRPNHSRAAPTAAGSARAR